MKLSHVLVAAALTLAASTVSTLALAQAPVLLYASEDAGVKGTNVPVRVDSQGRLIISNPGGGGGGGTLTVDGGIPTFPVSCNAASVHGYTSVGTSATAVPATAATGRLYTRVCLSLEASGTPLVKCRTDGTPAFGTTPGEVLSVGDCVTYTTPSISCIANSAATPVSSFECR